MLSYSDIHRSHSGKSSDKWESYLPLYDRLFSPWRDCEINVVEVGVQNGGSLEVMAKYFPRAQRIIGCDIDPRCGNLKYEDPRISVIVNNINSQPALDQVVAEASPIDIFIDDGSHISNDVIITFVNYFPLVRPGGLFLIEDTHTLYWEGYGGGILRGHSAQQLFKLLTDVVNYEHWGRELPLPTYLSTFFASNQVPAFVSEGWVQGVEFYNSMIVVHKAQVATHAKLGSQVIVGTEFPVQAPGQAIRPQ